MIQQQVQLRLRHDAPYLGAHAFDGVGTQDLAATSRNVPHHVAQHVIRHGWADLIGIGRMVLAYPTILSDAIGQGALATKLICRTFSDCTTAPRNGLISGCYPLDRYYAAKPEAQRLKEIKKPLPQ